MSKRPMASDQQTGFLNDTLYHELRCLLGAATVWRAFQANDAGFDVVVAMDAAFVHARNLYSFFNGPDNGPDVSVVQFGPTAPYASTLGSEWLEALNRHVFHTSKGRSNPTNLANGVHLNEQVEAFAHDILDLWRRFEGDAAVRDEVRAISRVVRDRATSDARRDARGRVSPLFE